MPVKLFGLLRQRCPRCLEGPLFRRGLEMHERCPVCELVYFVGSMYISYGMATILMGALMLLLHLALPAWDLGTVALLSIAVFVPFVPLVWRYSRTIWIYFDRWAWPAEDGIDS